MFAAVMPFLDDRQRRSLGGAAARAAWPGAGGGVCADGRGHFVYLSKQVGKHLRARQLVISVDTKKKEVVGRLANAGREYQPKGRPERVGVHDFPDPEVGKAMPFGVYDLAANEGFVV